MSRFGDDPRSFFETIYQEAAPWDIGGPQPAMAALLAKVPPEGPVLDMGCGSGDLSLYLAGLGYEVVGIDFVEAPIQEARRKASALPAETARRLSFMVADALRPSLLHQKFGAVVDSAFYHLFDPDQGNRLIDEVAASLRDHGLYYLHEFAIEFPVPNVPRQVTAEELAGRFTRERGWQVREIQSVEFKTRFAAGVPAVCACFERL